MASSRQVKCENWKKRNAPVMRWDIVTNFWTAHAFYRNKGNKGDRGREQLTFTRPGRRCYDVTLIFSSETYRGWNKFRASGEAVISSITIINGEILSLGRPPKASPGTVGKAQ